MNSIDPNATSVPAASKAGATRMTLVSAVALVLSVSGNVIQWRTSSAALEKTPIAPTPSAAGGGP